MCVLKVALLVCAIAYWPLPAASGDVSTVEHEHPCPASEWIHLINGTPDPTGAIRYAGNVYPPGEYFVEPGRDGRTGPRYYSCVCTRRKCVYVCCHFVDRTNCRESLPLRLNRTTAGVRGASWARGDLEEVELRSNGAYWLIYETPPAWSYTPGDTLQIPGDEGELIDDDSFAYGLNVYPAGTYCINPDDDETTNVWIKETADHLEFHHWHSLGMIISIPFLVATLAVYALIPELRNIPGRSLMCYVIALTASYVTLVVIKRSMVAGLPGWCTAIGYLCYLSLMASFFWLNLMAFDIYWTFGGHRRRTTDGGLFRVYCAYGFGFPLVFLAFALLADHSDLMHAKVRPRFGDGQCWFRGDPFISFLYMYLPLVLLVSANLFFFISTAVKIAIIERTTAAALQGDSGRHCAYANERNRYGLYVRLFVVMGITWTFEFITWAADAQNWLAYVTDICNCVSGVFIFFLFVWKRKVWLLLQQRLRGKEAIKRAQQQPLFSITATSRMTSVT